MTDYNGGRFVRRSIPELEAAAAMKDDRDFVSDPDKIRRLNDLFERQQATVIDVALLSEATANILLAEVPKTGW